MPEVPVEIMWRSENGFRASKIREKTCSTEKFFYPSHKNILQVVFANNGSPSLENGSQCHPPLVGTVIRTQAGQPRPRVLRAESNDDLSSTGSRPCIIGGD